MNRSALRLPAVVLLLSLAGLIATEISRAETSKTIENYCLHMFDAPFRSLANRTIKLMFDTARIDNAKTRWILPKNAVDMDFNYEFNGVRHPADDVLEDTFTDALLVVKNGTIVCERCKQGSSKGSFGIFRLEKSTNATISLRPRTVGQSTAFDYAFVAIDNPHLYSGSLRHHLPEPQVG